MPTPNIYIYKDVWWEKQMSKPDEPFQSVIVAKQKNT